MDRINPQTDKNSGMVNEAGNEKADGTALKGSSAGAFVFATMRSPRIMLAPPDDAGSAGAGAEGGEGGGNEGAGGDGGNGGEGGDQKPVRPDYIPESFWDAEKGFKADDLNALVALKAEQDSRSASVPATKEEYKVALPAEFKIEGLEIKDGESPIDENDPRVGFARDFAHSQGFTQPQFEGLIALGVQMDMAEQASLNEALNAQVEALGGKAKERVKAVTDWIGAKLGGEAAASLAPMLMTAKQVQAFERIMQLNRGAVPGNPGAGRDTGKQEMSEEEYAKLTPTQKINYARQHSK